MTRIAMLILLVGCSGAQATAADVSKASDAIGQKLAHCRSVARETYYGGRGFDAAMADYEACKKAEGVQ